MIDKDIVILTYRNGEVKLNDEYDYTIESLLEILSILWFGLSGNGEDDTFLEDVVEMIPYVMSNRFEVEEPQNLTMSISTFEVEGNYHFIFCKILLFSISRIFGIKKIFSLSMSSLIHDLLKQANITGQNMNKDTAFRGIIKKEEN